MYTFLLFALKKSKMYDVAIHIWSLFRSSNTERLWFDQEVIDGSLGDQQRASGNQDLELLDYWFSFLKWSS
jgi:hypothetical protein